MDPDQPSFQEQRILVLYNQDFLHTSDGRSVDLTLASRSDVAKTAQDVARALASRGHFVQALGIDAADLGDFLQQLKSDPPDVVFNLCESLNNDDRHEGVIPTLLDLMGIPYTGSGAFALGLALHKQRTHMWLQTAGIPTPSWIELPEQSDPKEVLNWMQAHAISYPLIVKPSRENASAGIHQSSVVHDDDALLRQIAVIRSQFSQPLVIEQFIAGREINVSFFASETGGILPLHEIDFEALPASYEPIVSYAAKWDQDSIEYHATTSRPVQNLPVHWDQKIKNIAKKVFDVMQIQDYGRCDLRVTAEGDVFVIDVNPNCDLSQEAGYTKAILASQRSYDEAIEQIAFLAIRRSVYASAIVPKNRIHSFSHPARPASRPGSPSPSAVPAAAFLDS